MKKILFLMILMITTIVSIYAKPRLEGNKIYLDESKPSVPFDEASNFLLKKDSVTDKDVDTLVHELYELFYNPNKVIEFVNEEQAKMCYEEICRVYEEEGDTSFCYETRHDESMDYIIWLELRRLWDTPTHANFPDINELNKK